MELKEFIKTALTEIVEWVSEASEEAGKHGATIGSTRLYGSQGNYKRRSSSYFSG